MEIRYSQLVRSNRSIQANQTGQVSLYVCGPTVYDFVHIGNMRPVVVFDVLRRLFEYMGYQVTYVSNYTDIDDKIIAKAFSERKSEREVADFFIKAYQENVIGINSKLPTVTPRVTDFIADIIRYIEGLVQKGAAYVVDGEVFFKVAAIPDYGHLSHMKTDDLFVGARVEESGKNKSPLDFF
jgi:cysteinyl-tRNA synthetase